MTRLGVAVAALVALVLFFIVAAGRGWLAPAQHAGVARAPALDPAAVRARDEHVARAAEAVGVARPKQILFGDLHVHSTFSADAFQASLPMVGGDGAHPVGDACDFARYCAGLDFWSITDHAETLTPTRWTETIDAIRSCNAKAGDARNPDLVAFLGWEWTQMGSTPANHYGHKNVILRDLDPDKVPARPIPAAPPADVPPLLQGGVGVATLGLFALSDIEGGGLDLARYLADTVGPPLCAKGVPVRDLPTDCREEVATPHELFAKLDEWGVDALVIPHGTTWGMYTPPGSAWDKQLTAEQHDPARQRLIEIFSGHGNSEQFRAWREVIYDRDGTRRCPEPSPEYLPSCWRAGEIIAARCKASGKDDETCEARAVKARQDWVDADRNAGATVIGGSRPEEWQDAGQCRDCFQPAFNYRPRSSVQYILALGRGDPANPLRFHLGFIGSSDNHSGRPGTGYKEVSRTQFTEARFGRFVDTPLGGGRLEPRDDSEPFDRNTIAPVFRLWETERAASFMLNGGMAAVHAEGRGREAIWQALQRREVYGTSGPHILLWFDLLNPPGSRGQSLPMGSEVAMDGAPIFQVRAAGSLEQKPGCPESASEALGADRLARLCRGECDNPSDVRRPITRVEVVRIRPQRVPGEPVQSLIEDPWRVFPCQPDPAGCVVTFSDDAFTQGARDALYYVRAIEAESQAVDADPLHCERDASGRCVKMQPCAERPDTDDCLAPTEERAWSSPIFVAYRAEGGGGAPEEATGSASSPRGRQSIASATASAKSRLP
ncbi:MAG TPA: DUF3604 domain-containing protein [Myxococcota bacterium]|nr:DUF3604 domain-containing protein [Myxococcota bacterium]